jgi:vacuolar-type H+-ATPase subunit I/STV1
MTVRFLLSYGTRPMQIFGLFGLISIMAGFFIGLYLAFLKVTYNEALADRPLLLLSVLLLILGVQSISIGLLGELIVRTYYETQKKAIYVVREELNGGPPSVS